MSYILEALRRAEAERSRGTLPGIYTPVVSGAGAAPVILPRARAVAWGAAAAVVVALVVAAAAGGWWVLRGGVAAGDTMRAGAVEGVGASAVAPSVQGATAVSPAVASVPPSVEQAAPAAKAMAAAKAVAPIAPNAPIAPPPAKRLAAPRPDKASPAWGTERAAPAAADRPQPPGIVAVRDAASAPPIPRAAKPSATSAPVAGVPATGAVFAQADLPEAVRAQLPTLKISGITYSSNAVARMAIVNGQVLHEGDAAAPGLLLEKIEAARTVWSFQGFRVGLTP